MAPALALGAAVLAIAAFLVHEIYSLDIWWQVAIGRDILETRSIPRVDRYAVAALGRPYHDSHWLFQVAMALGHRLLGMGGVQLATIAGWGVTLAFCYRAVRRWVPVLPGTVLLFLAAMASVERFLPRPEVVTYLMVAVFGFLLQEGRYRSLRDLLLLGGLQVLWLNAHGLFVIGPFLVGCYWLWAVVARRGRGGDLAPLTRALAVVVVATLVSPYGFQSWRYAGLLLFEAWGAGGAAVLRDVGELGPVFGASFVSSPAFWFLMALLAVTAFGAAAAARRRRFSPRLVIVLALGAAALSGRRNVVLFCLVAAPYAAETLREVLPQAWPARRALALIAAVLMAAWAWFPLSGAYYERMQIPARAGWGVTPSFFPHPLPGFLDRIGFEGPVLNSNTLGGFYLYHGYPRRLPLTDGRWEVYEPGVLEWTLSASRLPAGWRQVVARYGIRGILLAHTSPEAWSMLPALRADPGWRLVYLDAAASFWMPGDVPGAPLAVRLSPEALPVPGRVEDGLILDAFLSGLEAPELRVLNLQRTLELGARREHVLEQLGLAQIAAGQHVEAEQTFERLLRSDRNHPVALNELAYLAYTRGDLEGAAALMARALEIEPDNERLRENYRRVQQALGAAPAP